MGIAMLTIGLAMLLKEDCKRRRPTVPERGSTIITHALLTIWALSLLAVVIQKVFKIEL